MLGSWAVTVPDPGTGWPLDSARWAYNTEALPCSLPPCLWKCHPGHSLWNTSWEKQPRLEPFIKVCWGHHRGCSVTKAAESFNASSSQGVPRIAQSPSYEVESGASEGMFAQTTWLWSQLGSTGSSLGVAPFQLCDRATLPSSRGFVSTCKAATIRGFHKDYASLCTSCLFFLLPGMLLPAAFIFL